MAGLSSLTNLFTGLKVGGALLEGFGGGAANDFQAQIAARNAQIAKMNSGYAVQAGEQAMLNEQLKTRAQIGQTKAVQAASGIDVNTGSAKAVQESERLLGRLDAMTIRSNAARQAYGYDIEAGTQRARSQMYRRAGTLSRVGGLVDAGATLLEGASSSSRQHRMWQDVGEGDGAVGNLMSISDDSGEAVWR